MLRRGIVLLCIWFCVVEAVKENAITIRAKRQECKCIPNQVGGGLTCSCAKDDGSHAPVETIQQGELAHELTNNVQAFPAYPQSQARCGCLQIVFLGTPQYQCQCGDGNGNPLNPIPSSTIPPTTTTTTMAPITTTQPPVEYPTIPTATQGPGQCQCVMIRISGPASAQYQCNCDNTQAYPTLSTETVATPEPETFPPVTYPPETPAPVVTEAPVTIPPEQTHAPPQLQPSAQYPLTTTCVMYVGLQTSPCVCLPQYDQCAQNICCLKAKFRSHKQAVATMPQRDAEPSTVDMLMNILKKIKTRLNE
ncbi:hypothetical protein Aduo_005060 [Ancylostoma duodenale]